MLRVLYSIPGTILSLEPLAALKKQNCGGVGSVLWGAGGGWEIEEEEIERLLNWLNNLQSLTVSEVTQALPRATSKF